MDDWVEIHGFPDYEVNSQGDVRQKRLRHILKPYKVQNGHLAVNLYFGRQRYSRMVHQIVALAFLGPAPFDAATPRHLNHDPLDNRVENLQWVPRLIAMHDYYRDQRGIEYEEWPGDPNEGYFGKS